MRSTTASPAPDPPIVTPPVGSLPTTATMRLRRPRSIGETTYLPVPGIGRPPSIRARHGYLFGSVRY